MKKNRKKTDLVKTSVNRNIILTVISSVIILAYFIIVPLLYAKVIVVSLFEKYELFSIFGLAIVFIVVITAFFLNVFAMYNYYKYIRFSFHANKKRNTIYNEERFNYELEKILKKQPNLKVALINFSMSKFKKETFARYGYDRAYLVGELIFDALEVMWPMNMKMIYGFDYNESFLIALPYKEESDINSFITAFNETMINKFSANNSDVKLDFNYGVYFNNRTENDSSKEMQQKSFIASEFSANNTDHGGTTVYDKTMFDKLSFSIKFGQEIVEAIENKQFEVFYQPKFDVNKKRFVGAEALLRWRHPVRGIISPAAFIPYAEKSDLIALLDQYVFERVCNDLNKWRKDGSKLIPISINLSKRTIFTTDIITIIDRLLATYKVNPLLLEVEIVESPALKDILYVLKIVKALQDKKIKVAIDDFGTGYSSLSYVKKIPFDIVKIGKTFIDSIEIDAKARSVVKTIIDLTHLLEAYVVVEGVEDLAQVKILRKMGADAIQGYYYSRPLPRDEFVNFLRRNRFEKKEQTLWS